MQSGRPPPHQAWRSLPQQTATLLLVLLAPRSRPDAPRGAGGRMGLGLMHLEGLLLQEVAGTHRASTLPRFFLEIVLFYMDCQNVSLQVRTALVADRADPCLCYARHGLYWDLEGRDRGHCWVVPCSASVVPPCLLDEKRFSVCVEKDTKYVLLVLLLRRSPLA